MTMELRDLPTRKDVKGGSPKTPLPIPAAEYESPINGRSASVWRTIALVAITIIATSSAWFFTNGIDNVKHSEIQTIMDTRAPYIHDKQRIEERFSDLKQKDADTNLRIDQLQREYKEGDASILNRLQELERQYDRDHPKKIMLSTTLNLL